MTRPLWTKLSYKVIFSAATLKIRILVSSELCLPRAIFFSPIIKVLFLVAFSFFSKTWSKASFLLKESVIVLVWTLIKWILIPCDVPCTALGLKDAAISKTDPVWLSYILIEGMEESHLNNWVMFSSGSKCNEENKVRKWNWEWLLVVSQDLIKEVIFDQKPEWWRGPSMQEI